MKAISNESLSFLVDLKENNNREWFQDNKPSYVKAREEFERFVDALILKIIQFDSKIAHHKAKDCIFRIYRDVRFSKDKSPYKTHFGAHITSAAKRSEIHSRAGYYVHIEPGNSLIGGGAYLPQGEWLKMIRHEIAFNANELKAILSEPGFKKYFGTMDGEKLKKAPRDYPPDHPEIELLKYKSFLASNSCSDELVTSDDFLQHASKVFKALYPFDEFLNRV